MTPPTINPNGNCSEDQATAQRLSKMLRAGENASSPPLAYTRIGGIAITSSRPRLSPCSATIESGGWIGLLQEYAACTGALASILVDESGLPVAMQGKPSVWDGEIIGSWLAVTFDWADKMLNQRSRILFLGIADNFLTGLRLQAPGGERLTLGLLTPAPIPKTLMDEIFQSLDSP